MFHKVSLFEGLSEGDLGMLAQHSVTRSYPKNAILINEGDRSDSLYVIESGKVKVFVSDEEGREMILNILAPGDYFGELALIDDAPRSASVMTLQPTKLVMISRADFQQCLRDSPEMAYNLIRNMAQRIRGLTDSVKSLALMDVYGRVARTLLDLAEESDGQLVIEQRLTHQEIANMVGASREMVSRILKDLTTGGYVTVDRERITIKERLPRHW